MLRGLLTATAALLCCGTAHAQCTMPGHCHQPVLSPSFDYTIRDDGLTYKWTFIMADPGATMRFEGPNQYDRFGAIRTTSGYETFVPEYASFRFDQIVKPNLTTIFVRGPKGIPFSCNQPGPIGSVCYTRYQIYGNSANITISGVPLDHDTFDFESYLEVVPEPVTWAMMLLGFGAIGATARAARRRALA